MKRALLILFCALMSTQMFSESSSPYGTATSFAKTDVASTTFNNDIEDISSDIRKKYLVEKITWYDDETNHKEAYYEYDNNNRLVRRIIHNTYLGSLVGVTPSKRLLNSIGNPSSLYV